MNIFIKQWLTRIWSIILPLVSLGLIAGALYFYHSPSSIKENTPSTTRHLAAQFFKLPLYFESNEGQIDSSVKYVTRGKGYTFYFTPKEIVMVLRKKLQEEGLLASSVLKLQFIGSHPDPMLHGVEEQASKSHYLIGNDPNNWHTDIPNFAKVCYQNLYPGIDAVFYGNSQQLEYDILIAPGQNPNNAQIHVEGAKELAIDDSGNLHILTNDEQDVQMQKPVVYQMIKGNKIAIDGQFVLLAKHDVGFLLGEYDTSKQLVIDPILNYSTYLGGSGDDRGQSIAVDSSGNAYVTGLTSSSVDFPTTINAFQTIYGGGSTDAFVTKLNSAGALVYSTYLGGSNLDQGFGIAVDSAGSAYIIGNTSSTNFPTVNPIQAALNGVADAFIAKLNPAGSALVYSTYLGGSGTDTGSGIAVDSTGSAYVTGTTTSANFPTVNPIQATLNGVADAFIAKLNPAGSALVYSTYLGGGVSDVGFDIAVDSAGSAYVTGTTTSANFPTVNAIQSALAGGADAFITKINPAGSALVYSTYLGGSGIDQGFGIAVDSTGSAYVTGSTASTNFPIVNAIQGALAGGTDAFITKINPAGSAIVYSTYLGGSGNDVGNDIAVDSTGSAYITGQTDSANFPIINPIQISLGGGIDAFITKLNPIGSALLYSTYLGGSGTDIGDGIAVDSARNAYITGRTGSLNFPTVNPFQAMNAGGLFDAFIAKIQSLPAVTSIFPTSGPESGGTVVTITGVNFTGATGVFFGGIPASFSVISDTEIIATSPPGVGTVDVIVTTAEGSSPITPADQFTYIPPAPVVASVVPNSGPESGGTVVTINGLNFTGATAVFFGATPATSFIVISDNQIIATSPPGVGTVDVTVITAGGTSAITPADQFTYIPSPPPPILIFPPEDLKGIQVKNRFATQTDIVNVITWRRPSNGVTPVAYKIFRDAALTELVKVVKAKGRSKFKFKDHNRQASRSYTYFIVSVDAAGNQSTAAVVKVKPED